MIVEFGDWRIRPNGSNGMRCWEVRRGGRALRYYDTLDRALLFCMEYDLRNDVDGTYDLVAAIREYWRIAQLAVNAAESCTGRTRSDANP